MVRVLIARDPYGSCDKHLLIAMFHIVHDIISTKTYKNMTMCMDDIAKNCVDYEVFFAVIRHTSDGPPYIGIFIHDDDPGQDLPVYTGVYLVEEEIVNVLST